MIRLASIAAVLVAAGAPVTHARGLFASEPPWHRPALADTTLGLEFGITPVAGDTSAFLLSAALAPVRRGPIQLGFSWDFVSVRTESGRRFGFGDPKVFARLRLFGVPQGGTGLQIEGMARVPLAEPDLFPYASGGQEIELGGTLGLAGWVLVGCGYIWSEPPSGGGLGSADVPHALHLTVLVGRRRGDWALGVRADGYRAEGGRERAQGEASVTWLAPQSLRPSLAFGLGAGAPDERVFDAYLALRFATRLR